MKNKIMSFAGKWIEEEVIMLSKLILVQKDKYHRFMAYVNADLKEKTQGKLFGETCERDGVGKEGEREYLRLSERKNPNNI
jgi:hypothetical protein